MNSHGLHLLMELRWLHCPFLVTASNEIRFITRSGLKNLRILLQENRTVKNMKITLTKTQYETKSSKISENRCTRIANFSSLYKFLHAAPPPPHPQISQVCCKHRKVENHWSMFFPPRVWPNLTKQWVNLQFYLFILYVLIFRGLEDKWFWSEW
jgi:hypothetical protein